MRRPPHATTQSEPLDTNAARFTGAVHGEARPHQVDDGGSLFLARSRASPDGAGKASCRVLERESTQWVGLRRARRRPDHCATEPRTSRARFDPGVAAGSFFRINADNAAIPTASRRRSKSTRLPASSFERPARHAAVPLADERRSLAFPRESELAEKRARASATHRAAVRSEQRTK